MKRVNYYAWVIIGLFVCIPLLMASCGIVPEREAVDPMAKSSDIISISPSPSYTPTPTSTITLTPTATLTQTPTITPTLLGGVPGQKVNLKTDEDTLYLELVNADGIPIQIVFEYPISVPELSRVYSEIKWSPSGEALSLTYYSDGGYLTLLDENFNELITIDTDINFFGGYIGQTNWSPDGQWLVFVSKGDHSFTDIYKIDKEGKNLTRLTKTYAEDEGAFFTPAGDNIIFCSEVGWYIMDTDGENVRVLPNVHGYRDIHENGNLILSSFGQSMSLVNIDTNETIKFFSISGSHHFRKALFFPNSNWIFVSIYDSWGKNPPRYSDYWYRFDINKLSDPVLFATASWFDFSYDMTKIYYKGNPGDDISGPSIVYSVNPDGSDLQPLSDKALQLISGKWKPNSTLEYPVDTTDLFDPTPIPTWLPSSDLVLYESFENIDEVSPALWDEPVGKSDKYYWHIDNETLNIQSRAENENDGADFFLDTNRDINNLNEFAAKLKTWSGSYGYSFAKIQIFSYFPEMDWWAQCMLGNQLDEPTYYCNVMNNKNGRLNTEYETKRMEVNHNTWYDARIDIDLGTGAFQFYLDGLIIGTYLPNDWEKIVNGTGLYPAIGVYDVAGKINASFDDLRLSDK